MAEMTGLGGEDWNEELAPSGMTSYLLNNWSIFWSFTTKIESVMGIKSRNPRPKVGHILWALK